MLKLLMACMVMALWGCTTIQPDTYCHNYTAVYTNQKERIALNRETLATIQTNNLKWACLCNNEKDLCP